MGHVVYECASVLSPIGLLLTPWAVTHQAPLSVGFPRQEYWSGFPFASPGGVFPIQINCVSCIGRQILYH